MTVLGFFLTKIFQIFYLILMLAMVECYLRFGQWVSLSCGLILHDEHRLVTKMYKKYI